MQIKKIHEWNLSPQEAIQIQYKLQKFISLKKFTKRIKWIGGVDASFSIQEKHIYAVVCILSYPELVLVEKKMIRVRLKFPYIPGLLTFREGPALLECFKRIKITPDVIIFDGQGITHPRKMGIATHMGIFLELPTIGCAKSPLFGRYTFPGKKRGDFTFIKNDQDENIGICLRTRTNVKPVFVSPGNLMDLISAKDIVLKTANKYRLPEPIRMAHKTAKK